MGSRSKEKRGVRECIRPNVKSLTSRRVPVRTQRPKPHTNHPVVPRPFLSFHFSTVAGSRAVSEGSRRSRKIPLSLKISTPIDKSHPTDRSFRFFFPSFFNHGSLKMSYA